MQASRGKSLILSFLVAAAAVGSASAYADDKLQWRTVIGIVQANNTVGSGAGTVTGAPGPWSTLDGHADVSFETGRVHFDVRGLVLANGNAIGTPGTVAQVKGTLVCDTDGNASGGNSVIVDTPTVELDDEGNARFDGRVSLPVVCASEPDVAFLIRTASGRWIANGSVLH
jgi:hypothetical protein